MHAGEVNGAVPWQGREDKRLVNTTLDCYLFPDFKKKTTKNPTQTRAGLSLRAFSLGEGEGL